MHTIETAMHHIDTPFQTITLSTRTLKVIKDYIENLPPEALSPVSAIPAQPKHTPGPWKAFGLSIEAESGAALARVYEATDDGEGDEANARLIAASPTILSALEMVRDNHHEGEGAFDEQVRAAIAIATGEEVPE